MSRRTTGTNTVDLHNLKTSEAVRVVSQSINAWYSSKEKTPFTIICGPGTHSKNMKPVLFPVIEQQLAREGWQYKVNRGHGILQVTGVAK